MLAGNPTIRFYSNEETFQSKLKGMDFNYSNGAYHVILDEGNRKRLLEWDEDNNILDFVERLEIVRGEKLLFEGYDGMEFGTLSKTVIIDQAFHSNYLDKDICIISKDW